MNRSSLKLTLAEGVWLAAAICALLPLATRLASPGLVLGRGGRYAGARTEALGVLTAPGVASGLATIIVALAIAGWFSLLVGRLRAPPGATLCLIASLWAAILAAFFFPNAAMALWVASAALLVAVPVAGRLTRASTQPARVASRPWLYPGWVFLTGLGCVWLQDFSARSHGQLADIGVRHLYTLVAAYIVLACGAAAGPSITSVLARVLARMDRQRAGTSRWRRFGIAAFLALWVVTVFVLAGGSAGVSARRAELVRAAAYVLCAWVCYRWVDVRGLPAGSGRRGFMAMTGLLAICALAMLGGGDNGQVLLLLLALPVLLGCFAAVAMRWPGARLPAGIAVSALGIVGVIGALYAFGPAYSHTVAHRIAALATPFAGKYEYLSEIRWFIANAPPGGYGLGEVPWCGTLQSLSAGPCGGLPRQTQSDYVLAALAGLWGTPAAIAIAVFTAAWLAGLLRPSPQVARQALRPDADRLAQWIVALFATTTLVQLVVTCFGSVGLMPLTGVGFPLVGHGAGSLLSAAAFASLALNTPFTKEN